MREFTINALSKKWIILCCPFFVFLTPKFCISQKSVDSAVIKRIIDIGIRDQEYRKLVLTEKEWKEYLSKPKSYRDSIYKLGYINDSINYVEFIDILNRYGYVANTKKNKITILGVFLLHHIEKYKVEYLYPLLLKEVEAGRMPPLEFAKWYDRYLLQVCKKKTLYGEYGRSGKFPCVDDIDTTNEARKKIGLPPFKKSRCNE
jgi:hypothetical protein